MKDLIKRIKDDVSHGGKLGKVSAERLLDVMMEMAQRIEKLERQARTVGGGYDGT